jgi:hypothetical protein
VILWVGVEYKSAGLTGLSGDYVGWCGRLGGRFNRITFVLFPDIRQKTIKYKFNERCRRRKKYVEVD